MGWVCNCLTGYVASSPKNCWPTYDLYLYNASHTHTRMRECTHTLSVLLFGLQIPIKSLLSQALRLNRLKSHFAWLLTAKRLQTLIRPGASLHFMEGDGGQTQKCKQPMLELEHQSQYPSEQCSPKNIVALQPSSAKFKFLEMIRPPFYDDYSTALVSYTITCTNPTFLSRALRAKMCFKLKPSLCDHHYCRSCSACQAHNIW